MIFWIRAGKARRAAMLLAADAYLKKLFDWKI